MQRIRTVWTGVAGSPYYSNFYFEDATTSVEAQAQVDLVQDLWSDLAIFIDVRLTATVEGEVATIDPATGTMTGQYSVLSRTAPGNAGGQPLPPANQVLVRLRTPVVAGGRLVRGRCFVPGFMEGASNAQGTLDPAIAAAVDAEFTELVTAGPEFGVWSKGSGVFAPIASVSTWTQFAVMRSRRD